MANSSQNFITSAPTPVTIANGGTGQTTKTAALDALSPTTTKGNLIVHDGTNNVRHALGADGKVLVAELAQTNGIFWTEVLPWTYEICPAMTAIANTNWNTLNTPALYSTDSAGKTLVLFAKDSSNAQNDDISWDITLAAGTWTLEIMGVVAVARGISTAYLGAINVGTIDWYGASTLYNQRKTITGIVVSSTAKYRFKLKMETKHASASNYQGTLQWIQWRRTA